MRSVVALALAFAGLGVGALLLAHSVSDPPAMIGPAHATRTIAVGERAAQPSLPAIPLVPPSGPAAIDCARPSGNAARVDGVTLPLADVCARLADVGAVMRGGTDRVQTRLVLERMIDATIVRNALVQRRLVIDPKPLGASTGLAREQLRERLELAALANAQPVTEAEVDAEIARGAPSVDRGGGIRVEGWLARGGDGTRERAEALAAHPDDAATQKQMTRLAPFIVGEGGVEPELAAAASSLRGGRWSAPIKTRVGWVVIRVLEVVDTIQVTNVDLRVRVRRALEARRFAEHRRLLDELRAAARVEILVDV